MEQCWKKSTSFNGSFRARIKSWKNKTEVPKFPCVFKTLNPLRNIKSDTKILYPGIDSQKQNLFLKKSKKIKLLHFVDNKPF